MEWNGKKLSKFDFLWCLTLQVTRVVPAGWKLLLSRKCYLSCGCWNSITLIEILYTSERKSWGRREYKTHSVIIISEVLILTLSIYTTPLYAIYCQASGMILSDMICRGDIFLYTPWGVYRKIFSWGKYFMITIPRANIRDTSLYVDHTIQNHPCCQGSSFKDELSVLVWKLSWVVLVAITSATFSSPSRGHCLG